MLNWVFGGKRQSAPTHKAPPYEEARDTAASGSAAQRQDLAKCEDLPPEFLYYFASDEDDGVRAAVAANPGTPLQADVILAKDREVTVRMILAEKIGKMLPDIRQDQSEKLAELAFEVLEVLADDRDAQVRSIIAESIKSLDNVPKPIVALLAKDVEDAVAMPVLEFSPLLGEQDLLKIILTGIRGKRLAAVSRREDLTSELIDAIVDSKDDIAVEALIGNEAADISEHQFGHIVDHAAEREGWQAALASRIKIPKDTLLRLSRIATENVLSRLRDRGDLGQEVLDELEHAVEEKVTESLDEEEEKEPSKDAVDAAMAKAKELQAEGQLNEAKVLGAIASGKREYVDAFLAVLAEQPPVDIRRVLKMQSAKSVLALTWQAGLSMKTAAALQENVVGLPPDKIMRAGAGGGFPLSEEDLSWQAELLFD